MRSHQQGVSLVEVLVALVVMSVGMLGIASLYVTSLQTGRSALIRTQAVNIVNDMADRIRANSRGQAAYKTSELRSSDTIKDCTSQTCNPSDLAKSDLTAWRRLFQPPQFPNNTAGIVDFKAGASGAPDEYDISLSWSESGQQAQNRYILHLQLIPVKP
jgi:type IV pilus assembly protein PilV